MANNEQVSFLKWVKLYVTFGTQAVFVGKPKGFEIILKSLGNCKTRAQISPPLLSEMNTYHDFACDWAYI